MGNALGENLKEKKRAQNFFLCLLFLMSLVVMTQELLPSYFHYNSSEALSARVDDSHCDPSTQGFGTHCFGDFYYTLRFANDSEPWSGPVIPYPPTSLASFKPFAYLVNLLPNSRFPLLLYLAFGLICSLFPIYHLRRRSRISLRTCLILGSFTISSAPILMALDRGNNQLSLIPFLYLFCISALESRYKRMFIYGLLLVLFKPQMILLGAVFVGRREWKKAILWSLTGVGTSILAFLFYPVHFYNNIKDYITQVLNYQNFTNAGSPNPANISFASTWSTLERILVTLFPSISSKDPLGRWSFYPPLYSVLILGIVFMSLFFLGKKRSNTINLIIALLLPIVIPNVSFVYYLCGLIPILVLILLEVLTNRPPISTNSSQIAEKGAETMLIFFGSKPLQMTFSLTCFLLFIPWSIPWRILPGFHNLVWSDIGVNWLFGQSSLVIFFCVLLAQGMRKKLSVKV